MAAWPFAGLAACVPKRPPHRLSCGPLGRRIASSGYGPPLPAVTMEWNASGSSPLGGRIVRQGCCWRFGHQYSQVSSIWAGSFGLTVNPPSFRCLTASPRWTDSSGSRWRRTGWPGHAVVLALANVREGDPLGVPKLHRLARFVPDARAREKSHGKQPKLSAGQQRQLCRMHATDTSSIRDLAKLFSVSRPTVHRTLNRRHSP